MPKLIKHSKYHRTLNAAELVKRRQDKGLSQQDVADKCAAILERESLDQSYISRLEIPGEHEIPSEIAEALLKIFPNGK